MNRLGLWLDGLFPSNRPGRNRDETKRRQNYTSIAVHPGTTRHPVSKYVTWLFCVHSITDEMLLEKVSELGYGELIPANFKQVNYYREWRYRRVDHEQRCSRIIQQLIAGCYGHVGLHQLHTKHG